jgi:hypothetical protein
MLLCLGDRGVGAAVRAEAMTAGMKRRFEDRLQDLEDRLELQFDPVSLWARLR